MPHMGIVITTTQKSTVKVVLSKMIVTDRQKVVHFFTKCLCARPRAPHIIGDEGFIGGDDREIIGECLCDQQAVEWIAVVKGQVVYLKNMLKRDVQYFQPVQGTLPLN
jgi:hypothetical protein